MVDDAYWCWTDIGPHELLGPPGTTTHSHVQYTYTHTFFDWVARDTAIGCLGDSAGSPRGERPAWSARRDVERSGAKRCGCSYHFVRALPGVHQEPRWWGRCRVADIRREARCGVWVGRLGPRERESGESRPVRVHSPNSALGCDRSYLFRGTDPAAEQ